jgi:hypothetical protein
VKRRGVRGKRREEKRREEKRREEKGKVGEEKGWEGKRRGENEEFGFGDLLRFLTMCLRRIQPNISVQRVTTDCFECGGMSYVKVIYNSKDYITRKLLQDTQYIGVLF